MMHTSKSGKLPRLHKPPNRNDNSYKLDRPYVRKSITVKQQLDAQFIIYEVNPQEKISNRKAELAIMILSAVAMLAVGSLVLAVKWMYT